MERVSQKRENSQESRDRFLEAAFEILINDFVLDMEDVGFEDEAISLFMEKISKMSEGDVKKVLCLPANIRKLFFEKRLEDSKDQFSAVDDVVGILVDNGNKYGYTLGYHTSPQQILKPTSGDWEIKPYEFDDRDEMKMAYYSLDFDNMYVKKHPQYLYFVRAETAEGTSHRRDLKNNWGRAPRLSIVAECNFKEILEKMKSH